MEHRIARIITIGTYLGVGLLAVGVVLLLAAGISPLDSPPPLEPGAALEALVTLQPEGFLWLGIVIVIATPVARVAAALVGYAEAGDRRMALVSAAILAVIGLAVLTGTLV